MPDEHAPPRGGTPARPRPPTGAYRVRKPVRVSGPRRRRGPPPAPTLTVSSPRPVAGGCASHSTTQPQTAAVGQRTIRGVFPEKIPTALVARRANPCRTNTRPGCCPSYSRVELRPAPRGGRLRSTPGRGTTTPPDHRLASARTQLSPATRPQPATRPGQDCPDPGPPSPYRPADRPPTAPRRSCANDRRRLPLASAGWVDSAPPFGCWFSITFPYRKPGTGQNGHRGDGRGAGPAPPRGGAPGGRRGAPAFARLSPTGIRTVARQRAREIAPPPLGIAPPPS